VQPDLEARLVEVETELAAVYELQLALQEALDARDAAIRDRDRVQSALDAANAEVADLRGSTSWRVTAPLRKVSERVRGRANG
jgi:hypothetical protein